MLEINPYILGGLGTNSYIVESRKECLIIDPADAPEFLAEEVVRKNLKPIAIIATHGHFDHILGAEGLKLMLKIPFFIHKNEEVLISKMKISAKYWLNREISEQVPKIDKFLNDGDEIEIGDEILKVIHTPGHSPGSICLYNQKNNILFSGDNLFKGGLGRTDFQYSDPEKYKESLKKIFKLPRETKVYSGHGEETTIGNEMGNK